MIEPQAERRFLLLGLLLFLTLGRHLHPANSVLLRLRRRPVHRNGARVPL